MRRLLFPSRPSLHLSRAKQTQKVSSEQSPESTPKVPGDFPHSHRQENPATPKISPISSETQYYSTFGQTAQPQITQPAIPYHWHPDYSTGYPSKYFNSDYSTGYPSRYPNPEQTLIEAVAQIPEALSPLTPIHKELRTELPLSEVRQTLNSLKLSSPPSLPGSPRTKESGSPRTKEPPRTQGLPRNQGTAESREPTVVGLSPQSSRSTTQEPRASTTSPLLSRQVSRTDRNPTLSNFEFQSKIVLHQSDKMASQSQHPRRSDDVPEKGESSTQASSHNQTSRRNPTGLLGGDVRQSLNPGKEKERQTNFQIPYTQSDHQRDAATILEVANEMSMGEYEELQHELSEEILYRARAILAQLSRTQAENLRSSAIRRVEQVTRTNRAFETVILRFTAGPTTVSPTMTKPSRKDFYPHKQPTQSEAGSPSRRNVPDHRRYGNAPTAELAGPIPTQQSAPADYEFVERHGPSQQGWSKSAQPLSNVHSQERQSSRPSRQHKKGKERRHRDIPPSDDPDSSSDESSDSDYPRRSRRDRDSSRHSRRLSRRGHDGRDNRHSARPEDNAYPQNIKIEHQVFIFKDIEPVSTYLSKIDHLASRYGEDVVLNHLGIGILLDGSSAGAKWFMSLERKEKDKAMKSIRKFKKAMNKRFARDRNDMMKKGDSLTHSFANKDMSVDDYIDEKLKWYNEAGQLSEDWKTLRVYNGLDPKLKAKITMSQDYVNTLANLRHQVADHRETAYEEWQREEQWKTAQNKQIHDLQRSIQSMNRQSGSSNANSRRNNADSKRPPIIPLSPTPIPVSNQLLKTLTRIPEASNPLPNDTKPAGNNWRANNWNGNRRNNWNRGNWNNNRFNGNGSRPDNRDNQDKPPTDRPKEQTPQNMQSAKVFLVGDQTFLQDEETGDAYTFATDSIPPIMEQLEALHPPYDPDSDEETRSSSEMDAAADAKNM